ncbi:MAG: YraN family protein [Bradymonadaceae bacterium]
MTQQRQTTGELGEELAVKYLCDKGWTIRDRNYRTKFGEIDIVAQKEVSRGRGRAQTIIFVEVKARRSTRRLRPEASITYKKRRTLTRLGRHYMKKHDLHGTVLRFDVIAVDLGYDPPRIDHYRGAFDGAGHLR